MLTGKRAFHRDTAAEMMTAILKENPLETAEAAPKLSPALERILQHCLEKDPEERFLNLWRVAIDEVSGKVLDEPEAITTDPDFWMPKAPGKVPAAKKEVKK